MGYRFIDWVIAQLPRQGIEPYEVMQALNARHRLPRTALDLDGVRVFTIAARTKAGRPLLVRVQPTEAFGAVILGAIEMTGQQLADFEAWEATK